MRWRRVLDGGAHLLGDASLLDVHDVHDHAALLEDGIRKIDDFTDRHLVAIADFDGTPDPFSNVNRPAALAAAQAAFDK